MRFLTHLLCCLIPLKKKRKELRRKLVKGPKRRKMLLDHRCKIQDDIAITAEGVKFDISDNAKAANHIKDIFIDNAYNINLKNDAIVIDIGMNRGIASLLFANCRNVKQIYAYEPFEPTVELAKKNFSLNPELDKKINVFTFGLGKEDATLKIPYSEILSDCISTTHNISVKENIKIESVIVKDVAKIFAPIFEKAKDKIVIIKCDCEGAEFDIFQRLNEKNLIPQVDVVIMEYHFEKPDVLIDIFTANNFAVHIKSSKKEPVVGYLYAVRMSSK